MMETVLLLDGLPLEARLPGRLMRSVVVSPVLPVPMTEHAPGTPRWQRLLSQPAVRAPWTIRPVMTLLGEVSRRAPERALDRMSSSAGEAGLDLFGRPEVRAMLTQSMTEAFRSGCRGAAHDLRLITADWGLPFHQISAEVGIWHGDADLEVTPASARRLADALPRGALHLLPGAGHHVALTHPGDVLDALATQGPHAG